MCQAMQKAFERNIRLGLWLKSKLVESAAEVTCGGV